ncbi:olfactory receptor 1468-like [Erpetoichthys calabaricus]|uniref:olfactory receptor 1468-like n=1 Tax=Erpetoichthys calabaricus TaxID=27687 RepID=UPI002234004E|nr:olfactory receptor 1468-like [Erpetoichthys calabaricus]
MNGNSTIHVSDFLLHCVINTQGRSATICILTAIYMLSISGNLLVILVITVDRQLHTPMYIYIGTLAVIDLANSTIIIPKMISVLLFDFSVIPYGACVLQMFIIYHVEEMESLLLTLMAVDRYVAIVYPLRYPSLVTNKTVWFLLFLFNFFALLMNSPSALFANELSFCHSNVLPNCFCDFSTMVHVSCTEDPKHLQVLSAVVVTNGVLPLGLILFSYMRIVIAAVKISSVAGKRKIFSTCFTHLLVVGLFYIPLSLSYILPGMGLPLSLEAYHTMVMLGNVIPPMLNPFIYSFRSNEIKLSIHKFLSGKKTTTLLTN